MSQIEISEKDGQVVVTLKTDMCCENCGQAVYYIYLTRTESLVLCNALAKELEEIAKQNIKKVSPRM